MSEQKELQATKQWEEEIGKKSETVLRGNGRTYRELLQKQDCLVSKINRKVPNKKLIRETKGDPNE